MARLTYQNVAAPDFSTSLAGIGQASRLFSGAADSAKLLFDGIRARDTLAADRLVAERALMLQDPAQFQAALANGTLLGDQAGKVSLASLEALGGRVGTLTSQGGNLDALTRTRSDNALRDAGRADAAEYIRSAQTGNADRTQQAFNAGGITGLPIADQLDLAKGGQNLLQGDLNRATGDHNLFKSLENERRQTELAQAQDYVFRNSYDGQSALSASSQATKNGDARVAQALRDTLAPQYPAQFIPGAQSPMMQGAGGSRGGGGGGRSYTPSAPGKAGTQEGSVYDTTFEYRPTNTPITQMLMGDVQGLQSNMQRSQGHSPLGAFQINKATLADFAPRVLGADWQSKPFSPENQDKIGEAIFNARKDGNLKGTWAALPDSRPGAYKDRSWDEVKNEIAQLETGQPLQSRVNPLITANAIDDLQRSNTIANAANPNRSLLNLESDLTSRSDIAKGLAEGTFEGYAQGAIAEQLRQIEAQGFNAAQAGEILANSATQRNAALRTAQALPFVGKAINVPATTWDSDLIQEQVSRSKQLLSDASATRDRGALAQGIAQADQNVVQLRAQAAQVRSRAFALNSPQLKAQADKLDARLEGAARVYELLNRVQQQSDGFTTSDLTPREVQELDKSKGDPGKLSPELRQKLAQGLATPDLNTAEGRLINLGNIRN